MKGVSNMKFTAKIGLEGRNAEFLILAFFKEFNEKSSIFIHGNEAVLEIYFKEQPTNLINVIGNCEIIEFKYGEVEETISKSAKNVEQNSISTKKKEIKMYADVKISELDEIFEKFSDFDMIMTAIANWLELDNKADYFKKYVDVAAGMEEVVGKNITKILRENYGYGKGFDERCSKKIQNKIKYSML